MADRLKGKVAVVTGAAPRGEGVGNGMATAIHVRARGRQGRAGQSQTPSGRRISPGRSGMRAARRRCSPATLPKPDVCEAMAQFADEDQYGRLDILHNNVGIGAPGTPETVTLEDWNR
jgi:NAD(P)-dependent dehydrogenase (short-subunit alcohol dehydrogenase family)